MRLSFHTQTSYRRGLFFTPRIKEPTKFSPVNKRKSTSCYASLIRMARKPYPVHNIHAYQCAYEFQRTGRQVCCFFLSKKQYIAITANRRQDQLTDIKITTYSYHQNVDSSSTGSRYDTLLLCLKNDFLLQRLPNPSTQQQFCNPTKLN